MQVPNDVVEEKQPDDDVVQDEPIVSNSTNQYSVNYVRSLVKQKKRIKL